MYVTLQNIAGSIIECDMCSCFGEVYIVFAYLLKMTILLNWYPEARIDF